jgi:nitroreductase
VHGTDVINGCSRNSSTSFGEPGGPDYYHLWPVCQESKVYCHHVAVDCHGICETHDYLKIIGNFVLAANASFLYCFVVSAVRLTSTFSLATHFLVQI